MFMNVYECLWSNLDKIVRSLSSTRVLHTGANVFFSCVTNIAQQRCETCNSVILCNFHVEHDDEPFGPAVWEVSWWGFSPAKAMRKAIALQRVFLFFFMVLTVAGVPLYTPLDQLQSQASKPAGRSFFTIPETVENLGMDQYLLIPFLGEWTSIYQLFWCSPGVQGFDTLP